MQLRAPVWRGLRMSVATDHALATIASILAPPEAAQGKRPPQSDHPATAVEPAADQPAVTLAVEAVEATGYSRTGPGPMAAIRFKWTVRRGDDGYYVDETIGADSTPVVSGPMSGDEAIRFVDERSHEARQRFEALKNEMTGLGPPAPILAWGGGEK
jgi:hypothetical protein